MQIKQMSDIPIDSKIKVIVDIAGKKAIFDGIVTDQVPNDIKGSGISIKALYYNEKKINFRDYNVNIEYTIPKGRTYRFPISYINIDYKNDKMSFFTRQIPIPINYRRASRYNCGYDANIKIDSLGLEFIGYCKDASYVGVAFVCKDEKKRFRYGQHISAVISFKDMVFESINGKIVRIEDNYLGGTSIIAVDLDETNEEIKKLIEILKNRYTSKTLVSA